MTGWEITNTDSVNLIEAGSTIAVDARNKIADTNEAMYWVAPERYLGNKVGKAQVENLHFV